MRSGSPPAPEYVVPALNTKHNSPPTTCHKYETCKTEIRRYSRPVSAPALPFDAPDFITRNLVTLTDPAHLLDASTETKRQNLSLLYKRYYNQIQFGCQNPRCDKPTCLSFRRRHARAPVRRYTDLSARTLACQLVGERDPESALCRNEPVVAVKGCNDDETEAGKISKYGSRRRSAQRSDPPSKLAGSHGSGNATRTSTREKRAGSFPHLGLDRANSKDNAPFRKSSTVAFQLADDNRTAAEQNLDDPVRQAQPSETKPSSPQQPKDPKSFTQTLFDGSWLRVLNSWRTGGKADAQPNCHDQLNGSAECVGLVGSMERKVINSDVPELQSSDWNELRPKLSFASTWPSSVEQEPIPVSSQTIRSGSTTLTSGAISQDSLSNVRPTQPSPFVASEKQHSTETPIAHPDQRPPPHDEMTESASPEHDEQRHLARKGPQVLSLRRLWPEACQWFIAEKTRIAHEDQAVDCAKNKALLDFTHQSIFYSLTDVDRLLKSLAGWHVGNIEDPRHAWAERKPSLVVEHPSTYDFFHTMFRLTKPDRLCQQFFSALQGGFVPPPALQMSQRRTSRLQVGGGAKVPISNTCQASYVDDTRLASACAVALHALAYRLFPYRTGLVKSDFTLFEDPTLCFPAGFVERWRLNGASPVGPFIEFTDGFEEWSTNRLFLQILELVSTRIAFVEISKTLWSPTRSLLSAGSKLPNFAELLVAHLKLRRAVDDGVKSTGSDEPCNVIAVLTIAWCRHLFAQVWNGNPIVQRNSPMGGSLQLLAAMYRKRSELNLEPKNFYINIIADKLNLMEVPIEWLNFKQNNKDLHLLAHSFLFQPPVLVGYFRSINFSTMAKSNIAAQVVHRDVHNFKDGYHIPVSGIADVLCAIGPHMALHLVLTVRRDNVLTDAIDQIWRRQRMELLRPLKVLMGQEEGEQGIDHGGVQQEFFRVLFAEALDDGYGMFTVDERTRMTWFQPASLEPLYKFEVLGVLMSIAVYNFITLPVTFPLAFYRKLLSLKVKKMAHIEDGWPELARGLQQMLDWADGDVGEVFMRTYQFSYDAFGTPVDVDMEKFSRDEPWPPPSRRKGKEREKTASFELPPSPELTPLDNVSPASSPDIQLALSPTISTRPKGTSTPSSVPSTSDPSEPSLVTNANRTQFVSDYIHWLTTKSVGAQFDAFARGFYTCLDRTALSLFTPEALKAVIEGSQKIDLDALEQTTQYEDGYDASHQQIRWFWEVVRNFSVPQHRQLLEFVTASDRVPVNGMQSVVFIVQRNGGAGNDERLPTSMTCFGRLLLPEYSSREVLQEKLALAVENCRGFGVA